MKFEEILPAVRAGGRARREAWEDWRGGWLELARPLPDGRPLMPLLVIAYPDEGREVRPWSRADWDILEDDWVLLQP